MDSGPARERVSVEEAKARLRRSAEEAEPGRVVGRLVRAQPGLLIAGAFAAGLLLGAVPASRRMAWRLAAAAAARPEVRRSLARRLRGRRDVHPHGPRRGPAALGEGGPASDPFEDPMG